MMDVDWFLVRVNIDEGETDGAALTIDTVNPPETLLNFVIPLITVLPELTLTTEPALPPLATFVTVHEIRLQ